MTHSETDYSALRDKLCNLVNEGERFTFENFAEKSRRGIPSRLTPNWRAWVETVSDILAEHFAGGSKPLLIASNHQQIKLIGYGESQFEQAKALWLSALQAGIAAIEQADLTQFKVIPAVAPVDEVEPVRERLTLIVHSALVSAELLQFRILLQNLQTPILWKPLADISPISLGALYEKHVVEMVFIVCDITNDTERGDDLLHLLQPQELFALGVLHGASLPFYCLIANQFVRLGGEQHPLLVVNHQSLSDGMVYANLQHLLSEAGFSPLAADLMRGVQASPTSAAVVVHNYQAGNVSISDVVGQDNSTHHTSVGGDQITIDSIENSSDIALGREASVTRKSIQERDE